MQQTLFKITSDYLELTNALIENGGEATPELEQALAVTQENLTTKAVNYGYLIKKLEYEAQAYEAEIRRLQAAKKAIDRSAQQFEERIKNAMQLFGIDEVKGETIKLNFRRSEAVIIDNAAQIPNEFMRVVPETKEPAKDSIKKALKAGEVVPGAHLQVNNNLQIK